MTSSSALGIALIAVLAAAGCGGDDDGANGDGEGSRGGQTAAESEESGLSIDPESGPAGTTIAWTIAGCEASDEKGVAIYAGPLERYESGAKSKQIVEGPESRKPSGTITVPDGVAAGEYAVTGTCLSSEELGGGQVQLGVSEQTAAFTVTE